MRALTVLLLLLTAIGSAAAERRVALVIGNSAYRLVPPLPNPVKDARAIAERLGRLGFEVTARTDLDKAGMDEAIRGFGRQAAGADVAMVFYAGHGIQVSGRNYLVPVGARVPEREQDLRYDFVDVAGLMDELSGTRHIRIVVLDACRDNPIAARLSRTLGRSLGNERGLAAPAELDNTLIAYATATDATAADGDGPNSPFTTALLANLDAPGLDIRLMFGRVRDAVRRDTGNKQSPFIYASLGGDSFAFNTAGAAPAAVPPPGPAPGPARQQEAVVRPNAPRAEPRADWAAWFAGRWRFPDGRACGARYGSVTVGDGMIRFEWRLPNGGLNVAVERVDSVAGGVVQTTVVSDVGSPSSDVGHRMRYVIEPGRWTSEDLGTGSRSVHLRC